MHTTNQRGHIGTAKFLLDKGAQIDTADLQGWTPLHQAVHFGHLEVVKMLVNEGATLYTETIGGQTALTLAKSALERAKETYAEADKQAVLEWVEQMFGNFNADSETPGQTRFRTAIPGNCYYYLFVCVCVCVCVCVRP
jgi:hypothetical protein